MAMKPSSKTKVKVDFSNVESGSFDVPNGIYVLEVVSVEKKVSESSGNEYLSWTYKVAEGKHKGKKVWDNTSLQPQALWRLRGALEAMGVEVEDGEIEVDLNDFEGMTLGASIENEKYKGKDKPRIVDFVTVEEVQGDETEEEEEKPATKPTGKTKAKPEPEPEEEAEEEEEKPAPKGVTKKPSKKAVPEVGQKVTFTDEGEEYTGKVVSVEDDVATVKVGRDEWELSIDELTPAQ